MVCALIFGCFRDVVCVLYKCVYCIDLSFRKVVL